MRRDLKTRALTPERLLRFQIRPVAILPGTATSSAEVAELVAFLTSPAGEYYSGCAFELGAVG